MKSTVLLIVMSSLLVCQESKKNPLDKFSIFVGEWRGTGEGKSGASTVDRRYVRVLNEKFLQVTSRSTYEPQAKNPKGEIHEEMGMIGYDRNRKTFVLHQFHVEGFVNHYVLDTLLSDDKKFVFVTENIENIPPGWRARETYRMIGDDEFEEVFELAGPDKDFEVYTKSRLSRKK
jgi:hypothetical protein